MRDLYGKLREEEVDPWLDEEKLLPGQDWNEEIGKAISDSHSIIVCFSRESIIKNGYVQEELRQALDVAKEQAPGTIFLIPLKLEECHLPKHFSHLQWVNYFEEKGYHRLIRALRSRAQTLGINMRSSRENGKALWRNLATLQLGDRRDHPRKLTFGVTRDYDLDATEYWQLNLVLIEQRGTDSRILVELHVEVGKQKQNKAEEWVNSIGLNHRQIELLRGPIANRANRLQSGTTRDTKIEKQLIRLLDI